jgi:carbon storage regulator
MLILTRKIGETILIGENIRIMVIQVWGKQVRLGIEALPELLVLRTEEKLVISGN